MLTVREIKAWMDTLDGGDDALVGVDEGGLTLLAASEDSWLDVGGIPEEIEEERSEKAKPQSICMDCDGCGWVEGGKTLQTTCTTCKGTGLENQSTA